MAIAFVKSHGTNSGGGTSTTITLVPVSTIPIGGFVIMGIGCSTASLTVTVTDSKSNTYQTDRTNNGAARAVYIVSSKITTAIGTGDTITVTFSSTTGGRLLSVDEFSGLHTVTRTDTGNSAVGTSTTPDSGNATVTGSGSLLYGACMYANAGAAYAPGTTNAGAYTYIESGEIKIGASFGIETEYFIGAGAGVTVSANGTITSALFTQNLEVYIPAPSSTATPGLLAIL